MHLSTKLGLALVTVLGAAIGGCGSEETDSTASNAWNCHAARIPHGQTFECTSVVSSAATADGPSYYCAPGDTSELCPTADAYTNSGGTTDGTSGDGDGNGGNGAAG